VSERPRTTVSVGAQHPGLHVLTRGGICVPPTVIYLPYRVSTSTFTAVGRSQLLARRPGTHSQILSGIQRAAQAVLAVYIKRTCSRVTSASSVLGVLSDCALQKSRHSLTHSPLRPRLLYGLMYKMRKSSWVAEQPKNSVGELPPFNKPIPVHHKNSILPAAPLEFAFCLSLMYSLHHRCKKCSNKN